MIFYDFTMILQLFFVFFKKGGQIIKGGVNGPNNYDFPAFVRGVSRGAEKNKFE